MSVSFAYHTIRENFPLPSFTCGWIWRWSLPTNSIRYFVWIQTVGIGLQHQWVLTWGYTNDTMPEAHRQVCRTGRGGRPESQAADVYCWQILTSEARSYVAVLVIAVYCLLTCGECGAHTAVCGPHTVTHWRSLAGIIRLEWKLVPLVDCILPFVYVPCLKYMF